MPRYPGLTQSADGLSSSVYTSLLDVARSEAPALFLLNVGDTYLEPAESAQCERLATNQNPQLHNYAPPQGEPALLDAIEADLARRGRPVPRDQLQVTAGATSGLDLCCRALLRPGDEVIVLAPYWPLIRGIISATGAKAVELPIFPGLCAGTLQLGQALTELVTERTVAVYVNSPHNPTGLVLRSADVDALAAVATRHDLWLISDEAYDQLWFGAQPAPVWQHPALRARALVAHTLSKSHGLAGARVGFVHGPPAAMAAVSALQTHATYCAARPMQLLAARALSSAQGRAWPETARARYLHAARRTADALGVPPPESGTFLMFDLTPHLREGEAPSALLQRIAARGVVLTPGSVTGAAFSSYARLCYTAVPPEALERALAALTSVLYDGGA